MAKITKNSLKTVKRKRGRPTNYTDEFADEICRRTAMGETMISICKDPNIPCEDVVYTWILKHPYFTEEYAIARNLQLKRMHEEILQICDDPSVKKTKESVNQARLMVDSRKWFLSKVAPKVALSGTYTHQINQIKEALDQFDINVDIGDFLLKIVQFKAMLAPADDYKQQLEEIKAVITKLKEEKKPPKLS